MIVTPKDIAKEYRITPRYVQMLLKEMDVGKLVNTYNHYIFSQDEWEILKPKFEAFWRNSLIKNIDKKRGF